MTAAARYFDGTRVRCPDFFLVGAPKCGTTALASYLAAHPRIFFSEPKEPHFFNADMANRHTRDEASYQGCFAGAQEDHLAVGEGSVHYLFSEAAVPAIRARFPAARFVVMVRNPVEMAPSWYYEAVYSPAVGETAATFEEAWRLSAARAHGDSVPAICSEPRLLCYDRVCALGTQLQRLLAQVPAAQVLVLFQEDMARDPRGEYQRVLQFLGVPDDGRVEFPRVNTGKVIAMPALYHAYVRLRRAIKAALGIRANFGVGQVLRKGIARERVQTPVDAGVRAEMQRVFAPEIALLEALTGRDLSHWRR